MTSTPSGAPTSIELTPEVRAAVSDLKSRYFFFVDTKQWTKLRALFTDDAAFDGFNFPGVGPDAWLRGVTGLLDDAISVHQGYMPRFVQKSDTVIRARWSMLDYLTWEPGSKTFRGDSSPDLYGIKGYGHYEDEYRLTDEGWKIAAVRLTRQRVDKLRGTPLPMYTALEPDLGWLD